jgi:DNA-binding XRE family transcriptional regulator
MKSKSLPKGIDKVTRRLGYNIMRIRVDKGIYLPTVAAALGLSIYEMKNIEKGKYPHLKMWLLFELIEYFGVKTVDLFENT